MKTKLQVLFFGLGILVLFILIGSIGYSTSKNLESAIKNLIQINSALQKSQNADMNHDAIRADVFANIIANQEKNTKDVEESIKGLKEHSAKILEDFTDLSNQNILTKETKETKETIKSNIEVVKKYINSANELQLAKASNDNLEVKSKIFTDAFSSLEDSLEKQSEMIEKEAETIAINNNELVEKSHKLLFISFFVSAIILIKSIILFAKYLENNMKSIKNVATDFSNGDLTKNIIINGNYETKETLTAMSEMQSNLIEMITKIKNKSDIVATSTLEIAQGNNDLSNRTEQQASALEQTFASMVNLNENVEKSELNSTSAMNLAKTTNEIVTNGGNMVNEIIKNMDEINNSSKKITDIISIIDGIAFQTNILALNAAVEAARAGEQGRGFAVVADAAKEIKGLIGASEKEVSKGITLIGNAGTIMSEAVISIKNVSDLMGEINSDNKNQKIGVVKIKDSIETIDKGTQQNAALVEEIAAAASGMSTQAKDLVDLVKVFKIKEVK